MLCEKYRPKTLKEIVGHKDIIDRIAEMMKSKDGIPHLMFYGPQGTGKTTLAKVIASEIFGDKIMADFYEFNASNDRGIDFIRNTIVDIAKRKSLGSPYKIILMDEADNITADAQGAFRRIMEQYHENCRFIFTCNYPGKLIAPILSRFVRFEFARPTAHILLDFLKDVCKKEDLKRTDQQLAKYADDSTGDFRKALNLLEGNVASKSDGLLEGMTIEKLRKMSADERIELSFGGDPEMIFGKIWDMVQNEKAWALLPLLCDCQAKMNYSVHKTLFLAKLMGDIK